MIEEPAQVLAPFVAIGIAYLFFYEGLIYKLGEEGRTWARLRSMLPMIDSEARDAGFYTTYDVGESEVVGALDMSRGEAVALFKGLDFIDNPLAAHKSDWDGNREIASLGHYGHTASEIKAWGKEKRFTMMAFIIKNQLHVTLFELPDGRIRVTAHHERSPYNAFYAYHHFRGVGYDVGKGVAKVKVLLKDVDEFEPDEEVVIGIDDG